MSDQNSGSQTSVPANYVGDKTEIEATGFLGEMCWDDFKDCCTEAPPGLIVYVPDYVDPNLPNAVATPTAVLTTGTGCKALLSDGDLNFWQELCAEFNANDANVTQLFVKLQSRIDQRIQLFINALPAGLTVLDVINTLCGQTVSLTQAQVDAATNVNTLACVDGFMRLIPYVGPVEDTGGGGGGVQASELTKGAQSQNVGSGSISLGDPGGFEISITVQGGSSADNGATLTVEGVAFNIPFPGDGAQGSETFRFLSSGGALYSVNSLTGGGDLLAGSTLVAASFDGTLDYSTQSSTFTTIENILSCPYT